MMNKTIFLAFILLLSFRCQDRSSSNRQEIAIADSSRNNSLNNTEPDRTALVDYAKQYMGVKYCSAGIDPKGGFDCSGFVYFVFKHFQIDVPRSSSDYKDLGQPLTPDKFKVGDILVFYGYQDYTSIGHVGIICEANGMKSKFIHASSGKVYGVTISSLDSNSYRNRFYKCIDVISR